MQGRLSPMVRWRIQAFPWTHWREELRLAGALGFPLMEWVLEREGLHENPLMTDAGRTEIRRLRDEHGVRIETLTGDNFKQAPFHRATGFERARRLDELARVLDACADLGIRQVMIPLVDEGRLTSEREEESLRDALEGFRARLGHSCLRITFESDYPTRQLVRFLGTLPPDAFGMVYDIGDRASGGHDPEADLSALGPRVVHVHVKDRVLHGSTVPLGEGAVDFPTVFRLLCEIGYRGPYILQAARAPDEDHAGWLCRYRTMVERWIAAA